MEVERGLYLVNRTHVDSTHPCYEIDMVSFTLTNSPSSECVLLHVFLSAVSVVIVCGNLLVLISIVYFRQLHTPTNFLIFSLAVSDLLVGLILFPLCTKSLFSFCLQSMNVFCKVRVTFDLTLSTASVLNLCCISIDRYYAVCQPLTYTTKINTNVVVIMIVLTWSTAVFMTIGFFIAKMNSGECQENCSFNTGFSNPLGPVFSFYLPMVTMVCIYLKILMVAQKQARSIQDTHSQSTKAGTAAAKKGEGKATRTLAIVMGAYVGCWAPFFLCFQIKVFSSMSVQVTTFDTLVWIGLFNSLLNPFIYAFFYSWFRSAFRLILTGKIFQSDLSNSRLL
ncbi:trace amine-associated receptor 1-like [Salarias fasciatus]|uniref:trace amine-associated receptor 1-like n=1 Tax=Salarias fasciatus TaxID=181472 RepID=UPI001176D7D6|nr:trace amine-associated receptor 1-like [Salarias fasciatus]